MTFTNSQRIAKIAAIAVNFVDSNGNKVFASDVTSAADLESKIDALIAADLSEQDKSALVHAAIAAAVGAVEQAQATATTPLSNAEIAASVANISVDAVIASITPAVAPSAAE